MNAIRALVGRVLSRIRPERECRFCAARHYNECADARDMMEMDQMVTWRCVDGTHS